MKPSLLKAYNPGAAKQAFYHLQVDALREAFLPEAKKILAKKDSIQARERKIEEHKKHLWS